MNSQRQKGWALAALGMLLVSTDAVFARWSGTDPLSLMWLLSLFCLPLCLFLNHRFEQQRLTARSKTAPCCERAGFGQISALISLNRHAIRLNQDENLPQTSTLSRRHLFLNGLLSQVLRAQPLLLLSLATLFASTQLCFFAAVRHTEIANVVAIIAAGPVFVALGARVFLGERTPLRVWIAIAITLLGIALIVLPSLGNSHLIGDGFALLSIVGFSTSLLILRNQPQLSRTLVFSASALLILLVGLPWVDVLEQPNSAWLCAAAMGLVFNTGGRIVYANAPRFAPSSEVALFNPVETVAATLWAWWLFSEVPSLQTLVGAAVVIGGVVFGTITRSQSH